MTAMSKATMLAVFDAIADGMTQKQAARTYGMGLSTVSAHVTGRRRPAWIAEWRKANPRRDLRTTTTTPPRRRSRTVKPVLMPDQRRHPKNANYPHWFTRPDFSTVRSDAVERRPYYDAKTRPNAAQKANQP